MVTVTGVTSRASQVLRTSVASVMYERREYYGPNRECGYWPIGNASTGLSGSIGNAGTGRIDGKYDGGITGLMASDAIASDAMGEATATRLWQ